VSDYVHNFNLGYQCLASLRADDIPEANRGA
jgi:hypothetical protein